MELILAITLLIQLPVKVVVLCSLIAIER